MKSNIVKKFNFLIFLLISFFVINKSFGYDIKEECELQKELYIRDSYPVFCGNTFHHYKTKENFYKSSERKRYKKKNVKMAGYNVLQPGRRNEYKDYKIMARIMNSWDVIGTVELIPMNRDLFKVYNFKKNNPEKGVGVTLSGAGYITILEELRKLDPSWSLLLTSFGQGAKRSTIKELAGFYYRSSLVQPIESEYCAEQVPNQQGMSHACVPNFGEGGKLNTIFSRRPFLASFESGNFNFSLLTTHVVFTSHLERQGEILNAAFGVQNYKELGKGVTKSNFARFAELKLMIDFMEEVREKYQEDDYILVGDYNIEYKNKFFQKILSDSKGFGVLIQGPTTVTPKRYNLKGGETKGLVKNYDHFVLDFSKTLECENNSALSISYFEALTYSKLNINKWVKEKYYQTPETQEKAVKKYKKELLSKWKVSRNKLRKKYIEGSKSFKKRVSKYRKNIFQLRADPKRYYSPFVHLLSDHIPIAMNCTMGLPEGSESAPGRKDPEENKKQLKIIVIKQNISKKLKEIDKFSSGKYLSPIRLIRKDFPNINSDIVDGLIGSIESKVGKVYSMVSSLRGVGKKMNKIIGNKGLSEIEEVNSQFLDQYTQFQKSLLALNGDFAQLNSLDLKSLNNQEEVVVPIEEEPELTPSDGKPEEEEVDVSGMDFTEKDEGEVSAVDLPDEEAINPNLMADPEYSRIILLEKKSKRKKDRRRKLAYIFTQCHNLQLGFNSLVEEVIRGMSPNFWSKAAIFSKTYRKKEVLCQTSDILSRRIPIWYKRWRRKHSRKLDQSIFQINNLGNGLIVAIKDLGVSTKSFLTFERNFNSDQEVFSNPKSFLFPLSWNKQHHTNRLYKGRNPFSRKLQKTAKDLPSIKFMSNELLLIRKRR